MRIGRKIWVLAAAGLLGCVPLHAQRVMDGQSHITAEVNVLPSEKGATLSFGRYLSLGSVEGGVQLLESLSGLDRDGGMEGWSVAARGAFMFRLLSDGRRMVNLYAGAGAVLGLEHAVDYDGATPFVKLHLRGQRPEWDDEAGRQPSLEDLSDEALERLWHERNSSGSLDFENRTLVGLYPRVSVELYPLRRVAVVASAELPLHFTSFIQKTHSLVTVGIRYAL